MSGLKVFENMIEQRLLNLHTAYLGKVLSTDGTTAKIQPLGKVKAYGKAAISQSPITNVPVLNSARYKAEIEGGQIVKITPLAEGDIVLCVCCERDISEAKKGRDSVPVLGHHSKSASVVVGIL